MSTVIRAHFDGKNIVPDEPVDLPVGQPVEVRVVPTAEPTSHEGAASITSLPFFGMWADRREMVNGARWVRRERKRWQERLRRTD